MPKFGNVESIPEALRSKDQWVAWKSVARDGKATKVPINAKSGKHASTTNPQTWAAFQEAVEAYEAGGYDGIGFVFNDDFIGLDIDNGVDDFGVKPWTRKLLRE